MLKSVFDRFYGHGIVIINNNNKDDFIEFNAPEEIEYFKSLDWIVDYNEVKDFNETEILALGQKIAEEKNSIANNFNAMTEEEKEKNMNMVTQCNLLDYKMYSLRDILWFKQGHIQMNLPAGVELPIELQQEQSIKQEEKGIRLLKCFMFNKSNKNQQNNRSNLLNHTMFKRDNK